MNAKVKYWIDLSDYDMETAEAMLIGKRFLYVGFMCHQSVEKILKAYYSFVINDVPPHSHSLAYLSEKCTIYDEFSNTQKDFIDQLEPLNIEARYPSDKEQLLKSLTEVKCTELLDKTRNLTEWIKKKL